MVLPTPLDALTLQEVLLNSSHVQVVLYGEFGIPNKVCLVLGDNDGHKLFVVGDGKPL